MGTMRKRVWGAAMVVLATTIGGAAGQTRDNPCVTILTKMEYQKSQVERGVRRIHGLLRIAGELERPRVERFLAAVKQRQEAFVAEHEDLVAEFRDPACGTECALRLCRNHRDALERLNRRLDEELDGLRSFEREVRGQLAKAGRVRHALSATDRMIFRASQLARRSGEDEGHEVFRALRRAFEIQEEAKKAMVAGRYEAALKLTLKARDIVGRVVRATLDAEDAEVVRRRAEQLCEQTRRMIERAGERLDAEKNPRAAKRLEMAREQNERGCGQIEEQPYRAIRTIGKARATVGRLVRFAKRMGLLDERMERLAEWIDRAEELVEESGSEKAVTILAKGVGHYEKAAEFAAEGDTKRATAQLDIAAKLVTKAADIARGETPRSKALRSELRKTDAIVKRAAAAAETDEQKEKVGRARALVKKAEENLDNPRVCMELLDKATDLAFSAIAESRSAEEGEQE